LHSKFLRRGSAYGTLGSSHSGNEISDGAIIFHARRALDPAANVNGMWGDSRNRMRDVLRI